MREPSENEKGLQEVLANGYLAPEVKYERAWMWIQAIVNDNLVATRDAALEEAARAAAQTGTEDAACDGQCGHGVCVGEQGAADRIRTLKSQPARRYLDAETVREALKAEALDDSSAMTDGCVWRICNRLGLDLDAAPSSEERTCPYCHERHGRNTSCHRETATVENGLLPAPRAKR